MSAKYVPGMRLGMPALCWRVLGGPDLCCIRMRGHDGGIHEPKRDLDSDVDAEQMTHSAEEGTTNDAVTRLSEASFAKDWESAEDAIYDPTTKELRKEWSSTDWCLAWNSEPPGEDVSHECYKAQPNECANEVIDRLIADVEAGERHLQSLKDDAGDMLCDLEDQVKRLEAEVERLHEICDPLLDKLAETGLVT